MSGIFRGVGVGPGDPELLTLKAARVIKSAPVVAYPAADDGDSLARRIAADAIVPGTTEIAVKVPMRIDRSPAQAVYDAAADAIRVHLSAGRDVVFLCEGDPFFYGSFMYLFQRIAADHPAEIVPGVSSLTACAAALGRPLAARDDVLKVLPATLPEATLRAEIEAAQSVAIIKVGRHFEKVRGLLAELGLDGASAIIEAATHPHQKVTRLADIQPGDRPYFSTILVYKGAEPWPIRPSL